MKPDWFAVDSFVLFAVCAVGCGSTASKVPAPETRSGAPDAGAGLGPADDDAASDANADTSPGSRSPGDSASSEAGYSLGFNPSNLASPSLPSTLGDVAIAAPGCTIDTDRLIVDCVSPEGDGGLPYAFAATTQSDGSAIALLAANSLSIAPAASVTLRGALPLLVWVRTIVDIQGAFIADPTFHPTNGGGAVPTPTGAGGGPGGGAAGTSNPEIGASGGGYCGIGGAGGNSQIVVADAGAPLPGGKPYGSAAIVPLIGGSSGGSVPGRGGGGEGGGAIEITAGQSVVVGSGGIVSVPGYGGTGNGGAGGSGGAILLEAPAVAINGTLAANGGGGAVFAGGGGAQDGQPSARPALGEDANSAVGSAGTQQAGGDGMATPAATSSGGGGAGRIRINTASGSAIIGASATISPPLGTPCATQSVLR